MRPGTYLQRVDLRLTSDASLRLDGLRAIAALIVMVGHVRRLFFLPSSRLAHPGAATNALYAVTDLGHSAVMIFFVLSGFLISLSIFRSISRERWSWSWYLSQRLTRLWVVLIPALLLGAVWDQAGIHLFGGAQVYDHPSAYRDVLGFSVPARSTVAVFLGNLVFLQQIITYPFGSNGPLWSLSFEFWYYLIFPCLLFGVLAGRRILRAAFLGLAVALIIFIGREVVDFPVWLMGVAVLLLPRPVVPSRSARIGMTVVGILMTFVSLFAYRYTSFTHHAAAGDLANGLGAALGLYLIISAVLPAFPAKAGSPGRLGRLATASAGFSYTLYLVHLPLLVFLRAALSHAGVGQWQPDIPHLALGGAIAFGVLLYAWLVSRVTEAKTGDIRRYLSALLGGRLSTPGQPSPLPDMATTTAPEARDPASARTSR